MGCGYSRSTTSYTPEERDSFMLETTLSELRAFERRMKTIVADERSRFKQLNNDLAEARLDLENAYKESARREAKETIEVIEMEIAAVAPDTAPRRRDAEKKQLDELKRALEKTKRDVGKNQANRVREQATFEKRCWYIIVFLLVIVTIYKRQ